MMQKKSHMTDYSLHSLKRQNKREMEEKKNPCLAVIWELDREIILLYVHLSAPNELILRMTIKKRPLWWQVRAGSKDSRTCFLWLPITKYQLQILTLRLPMADPRSGTEPVVIFSFRNAALFQPTNLDLLSPNFGHLLISNYFLKVVLG